MPYDSDIEPEEITLEVGIENLEHLPFIESQDLNRFEKVTNTSYHLNKLRKRLHERDRFLQRTKRVNDFLSKTHLQLISFYQKANSFFHRS